MKTTVRSSQFTAHSRQRTLLRLAARMPVRRARQLVALVCAMSLGGFLQRAASAWEDDMQPVCRALVEALMAGGAPALQALRAQLPDLLGQVNRDPRLAATLNEELLKQFIRVMRDLRKHGPGAPLEGSASVAQWRSRSIFPTDFGHADLRGLSSELHLRSIFSARTTNADYLNDVAKTVDEILSGKINMATGRWHLMKKLKQLGYDPAKGFPQDMAAIPPAEAGSLQDLSSKQRIDLMLRTNVTLTRNYGRVVEGNSDFARYAWPAWELKRIGTREHPRGEGHTVGWHRRWNDAGESVNWEGALQGVMIARKDSPIWQALGDGAGGYTDTLGHPFGPFAFNSGYDQVAVPRARWIELNKTQSRGVAEVAEEETPAPMKYTLAPTPSEENALIDRLSPDLRAAMMKEWSV